MCKKITIKFNKFKEITFIVPSNQADWIDNSEINVMSSCFNQYILSVSRAFATFGMDRFSFYENLWDHVKARVFPKWFCDFIENLYEKENIRYQQKIFILSIIDFFIIHKKTIEVNQYFPGLKLKDFDSKIIIEFGR